MPVATVFGGFQGGEYVEVLGTQGSNPLSQWKVVGPAKHLQKQFDKVLKSSVYSSSGSALKLQTPKDDKSVLGLTQPFLVLQVSLQGQPLTLELVVQDTSATRRRLIFSSSFTDAKVTPLHCQVPFVAVARGTWLNLTLPLAELVPLFFRGAAFRSVDSLLISGSCRLRRVFTLRDAPYDLLVPGDGPEAPQPRPLPRALEMPPELEVFTQVLDARSLYSMGVQLPGSSTAQGASRASTAGRGSGSLHPARLTTAHGPNECSRRAPGDSTAPSLVMMPAPLLLNSSDDESCLSPPALFTPVGEPGSNAGQDSFKRHGEHAPGSWATAVRRGAVPCPHGQGLGSPCASPGDPLAPWNANATEGGMRGSAGRSGAARCDPKAGCAGASSGATVGLGLLLPPTPAFAGSGPGRPTTDSAAVVGSGGRLRSSPVAGRRAISAQVGLRTNDAGAAPKGGAAATGLRTKSPGPGSNGLVSNGRRRGSPSGRTADSAMGAGAAAQCRLSSSGCLEAQQTVMEAVPRSMVVTPGSPSARYGRRVGGTAGAGCSAGVNIPYTIQEGEAMKTTPRGLNLTHQTQSAGKASGAGVSGAAGQQPASQQARRLASPNAGRAHQATSSGAPASASNVRLGSPHRTVMSPGPEGTHMRTSAAQLVPGGAGRSTSPGRPERGALRSPARRDPALRRSGGEVHPHDLEGLLQVRGGVDASSDLGPLLPRLSNGMGGNFYPGQHAGRLSRSSLTGDLACSPLLSPPSPLSPPGSTLTLNRPHAEAGTEEPSTRPAVGAESGVLLGNGALLPPLGTAHMASLMHSTSITRDRYARVSSSSLFNATSEAHQPSAGPALASPAAARRSPPRAASPVPHAPPPRSLSPGQTSTKPPHMRTGSSAKPQSPPSRGHMPQPQHSGLGPPQSPPAGVNPGRPSPPRGNNEPATASPRVLQPAAGTAMPAEQGLAGGKASRQQQPIPRRPSPVRRVPGSAAAQGTQPEVGTSAVATAKRNDLGSPARGGRSFVPEAAAASAAPPSPPAVAHKRGASPGRGKNTPAAGRGPAIATLRAPIPRPAANPSHGLRVGAAAAAAVIARGAAAGSVASSVCEVDESVNLVAGWGGFGVDEDDHLATHMQQTAMMTPQHTHHQHLSGSRPDNINWQQQHQQHPQHQQILFPPGQQQQQQQPEPGSATSGGGGSGSGPSGLKVDGLGAPIWSNEAPSATAGAGRGRPSMDDDAVLQGDVNHGTFCFPQADCSSLAETAALRHGGYGEPSSRGYAAGIAMGGPLRRYTVDDEALLASSNGNRWQHNQGQDCDWAHVEQLMAAPVDLAAAARAFTPPVTLPTLLRRPRPSDADRSSGPQVLALHAPGSASHMARQPSEAGQDGAASTRASHSGQRAAGQAGRLPQGTHPGRLSHASAATAAKGKPGSAPRQVVLSGSGDPTGANRATQVPAREEMLDLVYDPLINCYYDHKTGNYWQLAAHN